MGLFTTIIEDGVDWQIKHGEDCMETFHVGDLVHFDDGCYGALGQERTNEKNFRYTEAYVIVEDGIIQPISREYVEVDSVFEKYTKLQKEFETLSEKNRRLDVDNERGVAWLDAADYYKKGLEWALAGFYRKAKDCYEAGQKAEPSTKGDCPVMGA